MIPVNLAGIPDALKAERRWMFWRYVQQHGRMTKIPCDIRGRYVRHNQQDEWMPFQRVAHAHRDFDGIGFALGDGWAGVDLDDARDPDTGMLPLAEPFIRRVSEAYIDISPSGTGYKVFGRSARIGGEITFPDFVKTPWHAARFFAVTGQGRGNPLTDLTDVLENWFPSRSASALRDVPSFITVGDIRGTEHIPRLTDDQVVARGWARDSNRE